MDVVLTQSVGLALLAFLAGGLFGAIAQRSHFCTMGAIADLVLFGDWRRMRSWILALAVAILGSQLLDLAGIVDLGRSVHRSHGVSWAGLIFGGLVFGFGMTLTGGCLSRTMVRCGSGSLKALVVLLVAALSAFAALTGLLAWPRLQLERFMPLAVEKASLGELTGLEGPAAFLPAALIGGGLLVFALKDPRFRRSRADLTAGLLLGALVPIGWLITGSWAALPDAPVQSLTFVLPLGQAMQFLTTSGLPWVEAAFGLALFCGVIAGALAAAIKGSGFRPEAFSGLKDMTRHLAGAVMMGLGGVMAYGCTIGQGVSGLSTLAVGSFLALAGILAGGALGIRYLERGSLLATIQALWPASFHLPSRQ